MYKHLKPKRATALIMAAFMAASSAQPGILAASLAETERGSISSEEETGVGSISTGAETEGFATAPAAEQEPTYTSEIYTIALDLRSPNGVVVFNEGSATQQTVSISTNENDETVSSVVNANGELLKQYLVTDEAPYSVVWTEGRGDKVNIKAIANDGFTVSSYESYVMNDAGTGYDIQDIGFAADTYITYDCTVTADTNRVIAVDFAQYKSADADIEIEPIDTPAEEEPAEQPVQEEAPEEAVAMTEATVESEAAPSKAEEAAIPAEVSEEPETEQAIPGEESEAILPEEELMAESEEDIHVEDSPSVETSTEAVTDTGAEEESEAAPSEEEELTAESEETISVRETEANVEEESESVLPEEEESMTEAEVSVPVMEETETEAETFLDDTTDYSFNADFSSMRLIVLASDSAVIADPEHVIGNYGDIYLLQYKTVQQTKAAYAYYIDAADAVEPDAVVETASEDESSGEYTETDNPVSNLEEAESVSVSSVARVIALLDTGAPEGPNVIGRVSLIDDQLSGSNHASAMVSAILSQNPDAQILSVRVMDNNGKGTIAAIVSGIEYAIEQNVSIINLSIYGKNTIANTVLEEEINKAVSSGITVVGAAGNDGTNVSGYVPGRIDSAYILGACDETGEKISSSNYGSTVDYYAVADNTSTAAAKFSGYISAFSIDSIDGTGPVFFAPGYSGYDMYHEEDETEEDTFSDETEEDFEEDETEEDFEEDETESEAAPTTSRPAAGSEVHFYESFWYRDKYYDFTTYNPYPNDKYIATTFIDGDEVNFETVQPGDAFEMHYKHTAADEEDYTWTSTVEFTAEPNISDATVTSEYAARILPGWIPQSGSTLPLPELAGTTIDGMKYTVPQGTEDFSIYKIYNGYDVSRFRTTVTEDGGFDINTVGTYEVTYSVSYFLAPDYEWYVKSIVEVVPAQEDANTIRNLSDSIKVTLNGETDVPYAVPVELEDTQFTVEISGWNTNILNPISPSVTVKTTDDEDITDQVEISEEEQEDGTVVFSISLPDDKTGLTVSVKDEANEVLFEAKDSYAGYWRIIDDESLGLAGMTEDELAELEKYYFSDEYAAVSEDPELEDSEIEDMGLEEDEDGTFQVAGFTDWIVSYTWKNASSAKLYSGKLTKADWGGVSYVGSRYTLKKALANKIKAYVADACAETYWSDDLQKQFDDIIKQYQEDYIFVMHCCATRAEHKKVNYYGWQDSKTDSTMKHFLKIVKGSNRPYLTIKGKYKEETKSDGTTTHTWKFKFSGKVNPKSAKHNGYTRQPHGGKFTITISDDTIPPTYDFSVKKVNAAYALDEDTAFPMNLKAYQDLSARFYVCTDPSNPRGSVVNGGILETDDDGDCDAVVEDLEYGTTYYCWEDPASTKNYTASTNPIAFTNPVGGKKTIELEFPNDPVPMNIKLKKESSVPGITNGNKMYSLANIPFTVYGAGQGIVRTPKTNANGEWTETGLWKDTYYIQEAGEATGFKTSSTKLQVTPTDGTEVLTYSLTFKNEPLYAAPEILLKKEPSGSKKKNASLAGATFRIDYYDSIPVGIEIEDDAVPRFINNTAVTKSWQETTNANGEVKVTHSPYTDSSHPENNNRIIPLGTVVCTELTPPTNGRYYVNSAKVVATFTQNGSSVKAKYYLLAEDGSFTLAS